MDGWPELARCIGDPSAPTKRRMTDKMLVLALFAAKLEVATGEPLIGSDRKADYV